MKRYMTDEEAPVKHRPRSGFWSRWIEPRIFSLTVKDWTFWFSISVGGIVSLFPILSPFRLLYGISIESLSLAVIAFASIGLGVSVALSAFVASFPEGRLRTEMQQLSKRGYPTAFSDLAFVAFWSGASNLITAFLAIVALILAGPYEILTTSNPVPAIASGAVCASMAYSLLQMLSALVALLENAGLKEVFERRDSG